MKPILLLDVDGVINACTPFPDHSAWRELGTREAIWWRQKVNGYWIMAARPVLDFLTELHLKDRVEIRWHTTWQHNAQMIADAFELPTFPVAEAPEHDPTRWSYGPEWWKLGAARRVLKEEQRPLIWLDDDQVTDRFRVDELRRHGKCLFIAPNSQTGLCPRHLRRIDGFIGRQLGLSR